MSRLARLDLLEGLTVRVTHNARENVTKILAYRKGEFSRAYRAILPMCSHSSCSSRGKRDATETRRFNQCKSKHQKFVDALIPKLIKSYR